MFSSFLKERKRQILLIAYLIISFTLMVTHSTSATRAIRAFFFNIASYGETVGRDIHTFVNDLWYGVHKLQDLRKELQTANEKIHLLQDAGIEIDNLRKENTRLKDLLGYRQAIKIRTLPAEVIARDPKYYFNTVMINKGRADGVEENMPVIAYQNGQSGVVGKTIETGVNSSKVLLITDQNCFVSAILPGSGNTGLIRGNGTSEHYVDLLYVDRNALVNFGDMVMTAGQGGVFPKGINIGLVVNVNDAKYGFYYNEIKVMPVIDFSRLDAVFVILQPESQEVRDFLKTE